MCDDFKDREAKKVSLVSQSGNLVSVLTRDLFANKRKLAVETTASPEQWLDEKRCSKKQNEKKYESEKKLIYDLNYWAVELPDTLKKWLAILRAIWGAS